VHVGPLTNQKQVGRFVCWSGQAVDVDSSAVAQLLHHQQVLRSVPTRDDNASFATLGW
jgi:hypothetical protein